MLVFFLSADSLFESRRQDTLLEAALSRHKAGRLCIVPVFLRHCSKHGHPLAELPFLPASGRPVSAYDHPGDEALTEITEAVVALAGKIRKGHGA